VRNTLDDYLGFAVSVCGFVLTAGLVWDLWKGYDEKAILLGVLILVIRRQSDSNKT